MRTGARRGQVRRLRTAPGYRRGPWPSFQHACSRGRAKRQDGQPHGVRAPLHPLRPETEKLASAPSHGPDPGHLRSLHAVHRTRAQPITCIHFICAEHLKQAGRVSPRRPRGIGRLVALRLHQESRWLLLIIADGRRRRRHASIPNRALRDSDDFLLGGVGGSGIAGLGIRWGRGSLCRGGRRAGAGCSALLTTDVVDQSVRRSCAAGRGLLQWVGVHTEG